MCYTTTKKTVPVVMGASIEDYTKQLPENSFIHVDQFESAAHLASYLHKLDKNDSLYNEHLDWIDTGEFIDSIEMKFCRYCAVLHSNKVCHSVIKTLIYIEKYYSFKRAILR